MLQQNLYTACVTPFTESGAKIDYTSLKRLLKMQEAEGNGVILFGSTGEGLSLSDSEKIEALRFVSELNLNTEIMIGVPGHNFDAALDWVKFCNQFSIHGYLMTTPIYTKPGIIGQTKWFEALLDASNHPAMLYNIPGRSAIKLHTETVKNLASHPKFLAIKDSGGVVDGMIEYKIAAPNIAIYCGDDDLMPAMAAEGAIGLISVASNAWPGQMKKYVYNALNMDTKAELDKVWWMAFKELFRASNPIPIKALLKEIGVLEYDTVRLPLAREDLHSIKELLACHEVIDAMFTVSNSNSNAISQL